MGLRETRIWFFHINELTQLTLNCLKSAIETKEKAAKYVQSE